jgi:formylmethanofuran dehydrogenase subunit B
MKSSRVGCIFYGLGLNHSVSRHLNIIALYSLVEELNRYTKFAVSPMRGCYNVNGANNVTTWQTGYPFALDMSRGYPRYNPGEYTLVDLLARGEVDAALILGSDPCSSLPINAVRHLASIPVITLERKVTPTTMISKVVIPVATSGIEAEGTAYRMDGVPFRMSKVVEPLKSAQTDSKVLEDIAKIIESRREV